MTEPALGNAVELQQQSAKNGREVDTQADEPALQQTVDAVPKMTKADLLRVLTAGYFFFCAGVNDGSIGPLIPYLLQAYNISTNFVSIVYASTFFGWFTIALTNSWLCQFLDFGAMLVMGTILQLLSHVLRVWRPPFALYAVAFFFAAAGQALQDTHGNTYVSGVPQAHRWLGFIHAMYMLGCLVGPLVASAVASGSQWNLFYAFPLGLCFINVIITTYAFWNTVGLKRSSTGTLEDVPPAQSTQVSRNKRAVQELRQTIRVPSVWLLSLFFFFFLGVAITAGGWVVTYLVEVRKGNLQAMGYVPSGYYGGGFLGRLLLAEPTHRFGERRMVFAYILICLALQLCFWLIPNIIADAVAISLLGFFSGPFFATGISLGSKLFSQHIKSSALAMVFVLGQVGGAIFPAITGVIAAKVGVKVLQPMLVGLIGATAVSWLLIPRVQLHRE